MGTDRARWLLSRAGIAGIAAALMSLAALHLAGTRSVYTDTISEYVNTHHGWLFTAAMWALALGSAALLAGMVHARIPWHPPAWLLLGGWTTGIAVAAVFPTDTDAASTWMGAVHNYASFGALVALLGTGLMLGNLFRTHALWARRARLVRQLALIGLVSMVVFLGAFLDQRGGTTLPVLGLAERVVAAAGIGILAVLASWLTPTRYSGSTS